MLKPRMGVPFNHEVLYGKFMSPRPAHYRFRHVDALFVREGDNQREGFSWSYGQISSELPSDAGEIPDRALSLEWPSVLGDRTLHREATVERNREGHGTLAGRSHIVGGETSKPQDGTRSTATGARYGRNAPSGAGAHGCGAV
jgi:hypothetical protein